MSEKIKGGISYNRYIWKTNEGACEACSALDGTVYENENDIPDRPHPNCKCHVEPYEEEEMCDCYKYMEQIDELIGDVQNLEDEIIEETNNVEDLQARIDNIMYETNNTLEILRKEYGQHLASCENNIDDMYKNIIVQSLAINVLAGEALELIYKLSSLYAAVYELGSHIVQLWQTKNGNLDKYYHSSATCSAAQRGELAGEIALGIASAREYSQFFTTIYFRRKNVEDTVEKAFKEFKKDQYANYIGKQRGSACPDCDCKKLNIDMILY